MEEEDTNVKNIDDVLTALLSMGFELEESQAAVQSGRLTVESAVEWLLAQKTRPTNTCRLYESNPYESSVDHHMSSDPSPLSGGNQDVETSSQTSSSRPEGEEEENVVSRTFLNTKQREIKLKFEEKQRSEAQRLAVLERQQKKSARALVLQQIADDREQQKQKLANACAVGTSATASPTVPVASPPQASSSKEEGDQTSPTSVTCNMQIRHPDGQSLRHIFDGSTLLQDIWTYATENFHDTENMCLMQPFPRRDFTKEDASKSLHELGLCPSVGLVLKKTDGSQQAFVSEGYNYEVAFQRSPVPRFLGLSDDEDDDDEDESPDPRRESFHFHAWGQGRRLDEEHEADEQAHEEQDNEQEMHDEELYELQDDGMLRPVGGFPEPHHAGIFGGVGMRLLPDGDPRADRVPEPNTRSLRELAVTAAANRHARRSKSRSPSPRNRHHHHQPHQQPQQPHHHHHHHHHHHQSQMVPTLEHLCLQFIANRLSNPKEHTIPLHGLSQQPAQHLLEYIRKEKLLKPKTLHAFLPCRLQKLTLDSYAYVTNELLYEIRMHTNLVHLSLNSCSLVTDSGLQPLTALKKLKTLKLGSCRQLTDNCLTPISALQSLATLVLENTGVTDAGVIQYITDISMHQSPNLKCLNLNRTAVTQKIFGPLTELPKLKVLLLEQSMVTSLPGVEEITQLITLDISHTKVNTESIRSLSNHPNLRYLSIAHTDNVMGDQALAYLKCLKLREIKLPSRHRTTDEGILHLAEIPLTTLDLTNYINVGNVGVSAIGKIHTLRVLLLGNTKVTDEGVSELKDLNQLEILYLDRTVVTNRCAPIFKSFPKLVELSLASTRISSSFLTSGHLNNCTQLERLNLSRTRIDDRGLVCLRLRLLSLLNLDGTRVRPTAVSELTGCPHLQRVTLNNLVTVSANDADAAAGSDEEQNPPQDV